MKLRYLEKEWIQRLALIIIPIIIVSILMFFFEVYGSKIDWVSQHIAFPDYFRKIFYETGQIFPEFSMNLGSGQNFAQFTYYGVMRPDVLLSYLFPSISMEKWIIFSSIGYVLISVQLFYSWMKSKLSSSWILLFTSCLFLLSSPILFHSHRHLMFMCYFPGLLIGLMGVDNYFENRKTKLLVFGVFLMILSSYFYSVSGLAVISVYGIYIWMKTYPMKTWRKFIIDYSKFIGWLLLSVGLSGFFLLPTAYAMLLQTRPSLQHPALIDLFIPKEGFSSFLYSSYTLGLTSIGLLGVLQGIAKKEKAQSILGWLLLVLLCIPLFQYILNGFQYVRAKALIPFIPLVCLMAGNMVEDWQRKKIHISWWSVILCFSQVFFLNKKLYQVGFVIDFLFLLFLLFVLCKKSWKPLLCLYLLVPFMVSISVNLQEDYADKALLSRVYNKDKSELIQNTLDTNYGLYRFDDASTIYGVNRIEDLRQWKTTQYSSNSNLFYRDFYYNIMKQPMKSGNHVMIPSVSNPYFNGFMGIRFLYDYGKTKETAYGYRKIAEKEGGFIEENKEVLPIAYVSYDMLSKEQFEKLSYPYSIEALYQNTIVEEAIANKKMSLSVQKIKPQFDIVDKTETLKITKENNGIRIDTNKNGTMKLKLKKPLEKNQFLIIRFDVEDIAFENKKHTVISINGIMNRVNATSDMYRSGKSDFEYVLSSDKGLEEIMLSFSEGNYSLRNIECYSADAGVLKKRKDHIEPLYNMKWEHNVLSGDVQVKEDGYFVTSIPFQKGLEIYIDKQKVQVEKVNMAFLGAKITKGHHMVEIRYHLPGKWEGIVVSGGSIAILLCIWIFKKVRREKHETVNDNTLL